MKAGLIGLTKAMEYAADNVTVNAISPGTTEEVAAMERYLVSEEAAFVTG